MEQRKELEWGRENWEWKKLRWGWCWGPKSFREEMLELIGEKKGSQHHEEELRESDEQKAERLVKEMLRKMRGGRKRNCASVGKVTGRRRAWRCDCVRRQR